MSTRQDALDSGLRFPDTYVVAPFKDQNWQLVRYRPNRKAFLWSFEREGNIWINLKADPDWSIVWRHEFESVIPAYHHNKEHWNSVILDGSVPAENIRFMIAHSYELISDSPTARIYDAVRRIPKGKVATYAQVARMAGNPHMSRAVGNALHKSPDPSGTPCYRVVNARGKLAGRFAFGGPDAQACLLEADGIEVVRNRVDLACFGMTERDVAAAERKGRA